MVTRLGQRQNVSGEFPKVGLRLWDRLGIVLVGMLLGCGSEPAHDHAHYGEATHSHGHQHVAPHGGAAVVLGEELYHLEFVLDEAESTLHCYVLDGYMENFVRIDALELILTVDAAEAVTLRPVASRATGETVGDTAHFSTAVDWAVERKSFAAVLKEITVKGNRFENVTFRYPEGNEQAGLKTENSKRR
ncbi:MAG: hypothetical protein M2R45_01913 [Verrucomicrobia subdivision 3 bacterium]|nr:hypothetical protein [Limisphaerales bacterium]MCS1416220.1 hypothetical protein [Limisphaerales bacterium]